MSSRLHEAMTKRVQQPGWRLGGQNAPAWLQAPCDPAVKRGVRADFELLCDTFSFKQLSASHPLRQMWERRGDDRVLSEVRFELHHLAHDLRVIRGVAGSQGLLRAMIDDAEHYIDYRYELRIAGAIGRYPGQQLLRLGGKDKGADIEVTANSGHRCGVACYRAMSITPPMQESSWTHEALMQELGTIPASAPIDARIAVTIEFPRFPTTEESRRASVAAFKQLWKSPLTAQVTNGGVTVSRVSRQPSLVLGSWETRITLLLPVPAREKRRLADNVRAKIEREHTQWAGKYSGVPVFAIEESDYSLGLEKDGIAPILTASSTHTFAGILCSTAFFRDNGKHGRHRMEDIRWFPREGSGTAMNLGLQTYGNNLARYGDGCAVLFFNPTYAEEEWLLRPNSVTGNVDGSRIRWLSLQRVLDRVRLSPNRTTPTAKDLETVVRRMLPNRPA